MSLGPFAGITGSLKTLRDIVVNGFAANATKLDQAVSTRAPSGTALSNATYTNARAGKLDTITTIDTEVGQIKTVVDSNATDITAIAAAIFVMPTYASVIKRIIHTSTTRSGAGYAYVTIGGANIDLSKSFIIPRNHDSGYTLYEFDTTQNRIKTYRSLGSVGGNNVTFKTIFTFVEFK